MTPDEAIQHLGRVHVREILRSGRAFDVAAESFNGHAITAQLRREYRTATAYYVLAASPEALLWQACRPLDDLREAYLEGSVRARREMERRGAEMPENLAVHGAWL
jgi:hypothetical protein